MNGRQRHLLVVVHAARIQEQDGAKLVLERVRGRLPRLRLIWADGGYHVHWLLDWVLEIVKRPVGAKGFVLLPRRWGVERTFGWLSHYRLLSKDYEVLPRNSEALVYVAMIHLMVRRLAHDSSPPPS